MCLSDIQSLISIYLMEKPSLPEKMKQPLYGSQRTRYFLKLEWKIMVSMCDGQMMEEDILKLMVSSVYFTIDIPWNSGEINE